MELFENWQETKDILLDGLTERKKAILAPLLENQKQYVMETADALNTSAGAIANFQKIMIPMLRRIIPGTISTELVGTQPMPGPVGLAYSLRFLFGEAVTGTDTRVGAGLYDDSTTIAAGDEVYAVQNSKLKRYYSSADVGTAGYPPALTAATSNGFASTTANSEAFGGRSLRLEVLKQTVTAGSRKLQAKWTVESQHDLNVQHGLDLEAEITAALSAQIVNDIDQEIIRDLEALAGTVETYDFATTGAAAGYTPHFVGDRFAALGVLINKVANQIARKTRRGKANWMVCSPLVVSALQSATKSVFAPAVQGSFDTPNQTKLVGTLNGDIKVYSYVFWDQEATGAATTQDPIIMGYKGGTGEMDSGYFYCPYVPLTSSNVIIDPNTYNPRVSLSTRYGKAVFTSTGTSLGNSADYYGRILVSNLAFL